MIMYNGSWEKEVRTTIRGDPIDAFNRISVSNDELPENNHVNNPHIVSEWYFFSLLMNSIAIKKH